MKFCRYVANFYPYIFANFGKFILIFIEMLLITVLYENLSCSYEFHQVKLLWLHCQGGVATIHLTSIH